MSRRLAIGMRCFGEDVEHLLDKFPADTKDVDWLKYIGQKDLVLITRDLKVRFRPAEIAAIRNYKVGAFFMGGKNRTSCQLIQQLIRHWPRIKEYAGKQQNNKPYAYRIPPKGTTFDKMAI